MPEENYPKSDFIFDAEENVSDRFDTDMGPNLDMGPTRSLEEKFPKLPQLFDESIPPQNRLDAVLEALTELPSPNSDQINIYKLEISKLVQILKDKNINTNL